MIRELQPTEPVRGFLLTRQSMDVRSGTSRVANQLRFWLTTDEGPLEVLLENEPLYFYLPVAAQAQAISLLKQHGLHGWLRPGKLQSFAFEPVIACCFATQTRFHQAVTLLQQQGIRLYEADIRHSDRALMERFITGGMAVTGRIRQLPHHRQIRATTLMPCEVIPTFCVLSLDVECSMEGELYSVALYLQKGEQWLVSRVIMVGEARAYSGDFSIQWVDNEETLLLALGRELQRLDPDLIIGWNVVNFDFRLLIQRAARYQLTLQWGRGGGRVRWKEGMDEGQGQVQIPGRVVLDGIALLKSATWQFDSYSLESVARKVLGRGKLIEDPDERGSEVTRLFVEDKLALARYNLEDCRLVSEIFARCHLLAFARLRSQLTGLELDRYGGSVAAFSHLYLPRLHQRGFVAPNLHSLPPSSSPGGFVMTSRPGLYHHVLVLDFKSLYPSIIRTFAIDPLGLKLAEMAQAPPGSMSPASTVPGFLGASFSRDAPILPELIARLWQERDEAKRRKDEPLSRAIKILMNSFYGVLGSAGCRFFDPRLASSITLRGHWIMQESSKQIEAQGYPVIYGDTDSMFVWLQGEYDEQQACAIGQQLATSLTAYWRDRLETEFAIDSCLELQFERHYRRFFMPTLRGTEIGSKKRYAGLSGESEEQLIFKGMETVRTDWTELAKQFQTGLYWRIFHDEDPGPFIRDMISKTRAGELDEWLVYRKRLRRRLDEYDKNTPPHVRAARMAEERRVQEGLPPRYRRKASIAYVMTTQGPEPVEYRQSALDYEHYIDKQLRPVADAVLPFINRHFAQWSDEQLSLF